MIIDNDDNNYDNLIGHDEDINNDCEKMIVLLILILIIIIIATSLLLLLLLLSQYVVLKIEVNIMAMYRSASSGA